MTTTTPAADQQIIAAVTSWDGVHSAHGNRGELSLRVGRREIGHLHGDRVAHFGFPRRQWARLMEDGVVEPHVMHDGWAARRIAGPEDVAMVITLMRLNYDRVVGRHGVPDGEA